MHYRTLSRPWLRKGIGLLLAMCLSSAAAFAQAERNPVHAMAARVSGGAARVIFMFKPDSALLRKHVLLFSASPREK